MTTDAPEGATVAELQAELAAVEKEYGVTITSVFPGTDPNTSEEALLRELIRSLRAVGEEWKSGTLEVVELDD